MWITNGGVADVAVVWAKTDDGIRGFVVPRDTKGFTTQDIHRKHSLRASITSELVFDDVRLPEDAVLPGVDRDARPAVVPERGALRDPLGRRRRGAHVPRDRARLRARAARSSAARSPASSSRSRSS